MKDMGPVAEAEAARALMFHHCSVGNYVFDRSFPQCVLCPYETEDAAHFVEAIELRLDFKEACGRARVELEAGKLQEEVALFTLFNAVLTPFYFVGFDTVI